MKEKRSDILTFKASSHFRNHLNKKATEKNLKLGTFIKAILKKHTAYKEPDLV